MKNKKMILYIVIVTIVINIILFLGYSYIFNNFAKIDVNEVENKTTSADNHDDIQQKNIKGFDINKFENQYKFSDNYNETPQENDINTLLEAEKQISTFLKQSKESKSVNNIVFISFLNILKSYTKREFSFNIEENGDEVYLGTLQGKYIKLGINKYGYKYGYYKITNPEINSIFFNYVGEGYYSSLINYRYLRDAYSIYLDSDMQKYLDIKCKQVEDLEYKELYSDGYLNANAFKIKDWILDLQDFIKSYPQFILNKEVKDEIHSYVSMLMWDDKHTFDFETNKITTESYDAYIDFLEHTDKNTTEYKVVKKAFTILKYNNFKMSKTFENFVQKYKECTDTFVDTDI